MALLIPRSNRNHALDVNPPNADKSLTVHGSDWLWAVTAIYFLSFLGFVAHCHIARHGERVFHYLFSIAAFTGGIAYFAMASDLGNTPVLTELNNGGHKVTRQFWYARYINWFVGWAMLDIASLLLSGVSWATVLFAIGLTWIWVVSWLCGALISTTYKWAFFVFGVFAYFLLALNLSYWGLSSARRIGSARHYTFTTSLLLFVWMLYSIAWGLDEGGNKISVTSGFIFYGILDLITVPVLGHMFLVLGRSWDYGALGLQFTQYGRLGRREEGVFPEKTAPTAAGGEAVRTA
jgi:bacteriorhodopsin